LEPPRIRKASSCDIQMMITLSNEAYGNSYEFTGFSQTDFPLDKSDNFALVAESDQTPIGCVMIESPSAFDPNEAEITILAASSKHRTRDLEEALIEAAENNVQVACTSFWVPADNEKTSWLPLRGYEIEPGYSHFVAALTALPKEPVVEGVRVRSMRESEESQVIDVVNAAYGKRRLTQDHFDRWRREDPLFNEDWVLVAISDGKMVGVLCLRQDLQYNRVLRRRRGYVGPAATLSQYRSRGIGKALNWHGMKFLKAQGLNEASLYTAENNLPVYRMVSALGYERRYTWKRFKKTLRSSRIPEAIQ